jgi:hypothetical protein
MPVIDLSNTVLLARLRGTSLSMPIMCSRRGVRMVSFLPLEKLADVEEAVAIFHARVRYGMW